MSSPFDWLAPSPGEQMQQAAEELQRAYQTYLQALEPQIKAGFRKEIKAAIDPAMGGGTETRIYLSPELLRAARKAFGMSDEASAFSVGNCVGGDVQHYILGGLDEKGNFLADQMWGKNHETLHCDRERMTISKEKPKGDPQANRDVDKMYFSWR